MKRVKVGDMISLRMFKESFGLGVTRFVTGKFHVMGITGDLVILQEETNCYTFIDKVEKIENHLNKIK